jgi:hypothetical protein
MIPRRRGQCQISLEIINGQSRVRIKAESVRRLYVGKTHAIYLLLFLKGTPWNTSLSDIRNQLEFIGFMDLDSAFSEFGNTIMRDVDPCYRYCRGAAYNRIGEFMFLMRAVMIRHLQNQMYRGTSTTLMSLPPKVRSTVVRWYIALNKLTAIVAFLVINRRSVHC